MLLPEGPVAAGGRTRGSDQKTRHRTVMPLARVIKAGSRDEAAERSTNAQRTNAQTQSNKKQMIRRRTVTDDEPTIIIASSSEHV